MLQQEIINLLKKVSKQLEGISLTQDIIKTEIFVLHKELLEFQEYTLRKLASKAQARAETRTVN
jgi:hypothetical protein